jgi:hypothetical protein
MQYFIAKFYCKIFFITSIIYGTCLSSINLVEIHASLNIFLLLLKLILIKFFLETFFIFSIITCYKSWMNVNSSSKLKNHFTLSFFNIHHLATLLGLLQMFV